MQRVAENYRKIRNNLFRYVLGNLYDFDPQRMQSPSSRWKRSISTCCARRGHAADVLRWYDEFAFHKIYQRINTSAWWN